MTERETLRVFHETKVFQIIGGQWVWWCTCAQADTFNAPGAAARAAEQHKSRWQIACVTGRHADDGRCLCAAEVARLQANGLDELDAVALILGLTTSVLGCLGRDREDVGNLAADEDLVCHHDNIVSNASSRVVR